MPTQTTMTDTTSLQRARDLADLLDTKFTIPGTGIRYGWDAIVGLIPVVGDSATTLLGALIVLEAKRQGVRRGILLKMVANLFIDWLIGLVPIIDIPLDIAFKAHQRNRKLLDRAIAAREPRA